MSSPCRRIVPHLLSLVKLLLLLQWSIPRSTAFVLSSRVISRQYPNPYMPAGARVTNWRQRTKRPSSHGAIGDALRVLKAALEVFPAERVEPGCVLWASEENYGHSTFKSVVLVYEHGEGMLTKGVAVDKGLEFTIGEMSSADIGPLSNNRLFRGGEEGGSAAIMIHKYGLPASRALGDSGLFVGGFQAALGLVTAGEAQPADFKFFFNYMTWPEGALEEQVGRGQWKVVKLPNHVLLDDKRMRDMELWGRVDHFMKKHWEQ